MGKVLGVFSGKGGIGKTTVSSNLAIALKDLGRKVSAVDGNITTPHLSYYMGMDEHDVNLNDVLRGSFSIFSASYHHDGVNIVPSSSYVSNLVGADPTGMKEHVKSLSGMHDLVIVDSAPGFGKEAISAMKACDEIVLVCAPRPAELMDAMKCHSIAEKLGVRTAGIVLNMAGATKGEYTRERVEYLTKLPVLASVPFDRNIMESTKRRSPILNYSPYSSASESFRELGAKIAGENYSRKGSLKRAYLSMKHRVGGKQKKSDLFLHPGIEKSVKTSADDVLGILKSKGDCEIRQIGGFLKMSEEEAYHWCKVLESRGLVSLEKSLLGRDMVRLVG
jgi:MinD-like ATPase involved in chromosome partitioning or flagellar assembly